MKTCTKCGVLKPLDQYGAHKMGRGGKRAACKPCHAAWNKGWAATPAGRESKRLTAIRYRENHPEKARESVRKHHAANWEKIRQCEKNWVSNNRQKKNTANSVRHNRLGLGKCAWAIQPEIQAFYDKRDLMTSLTGQPWHVDHVIPLQGEMVSGLHHPDNLQVIPAFENLSKGNSYV